MKTLKIALASALVASVALSADVNTLAKEVADKHFKLNKEATALQMKIQELCKQKKQIMADATKKLTSQEDVKAFHEELKYQNRQNLSTLKRDEPYIEGLCKMPLRDKPRFSGQKGPRPGAMPCKTGDCPFAPDAK